VGRKNKENSILLLRVSPEMKRKVVRLAEKENSTVNSYLKNVINSHIDAIENPKIDERNSKIAVLRFIDSPKEIPDVVKVLERYEPRKGKKVRAKK